MESSDFTPASAGASESAMGMGAGASTNTNTTDGGALSSARERLADVGSSVREKASGAKDSLANMMESRGMDGAATWLRDADLDGLKSSIETQVKEHPGRTLLIAVGLGYLLGKALRK